MNVKKGDLAIVIKDDEREENIGIICEVKEYFGKIGYLRDDGFLVDPWRVVSVTRPFILINGEASAMEVWVSDKMLKPVSGLHDPYEEKHHAFTPVREYLNLF